MISQEIKAEREALQEQIWQATERLEQLQAICTHETTHVGLYSWRVGSISPALICSDCGKKIEN